MRYAKVLALLIALAPVTALCQLFVGSGTVMEPNYRNGEVLEIAPLSFRQLRPGMVVAFYYSEPGINEVIAARLIEKNGNEWMVRADTIDAPFQQTVKEYNLLGRVTIYRYKDIYRDVKPITVKLKGLYVLYPTHYPHNNSDVPIRSFDKAQSPHGVPESGHTALLLGAALTLIVYVKRCHVE